MCWSADGFTGMAAQGAVATGVTLLRRDLPAIWLTPGNFALMEALQVRAMR